MNAVVLAGGENPFDVEAPSKALVPLAGRPMVAWVLEALRQGGVETVALVGPRAPLAPAPELWLEDRGDLLANLEAALRALPPGRVLVATGDVPLITGATVRRLLEEAPEVALVYPIVPKEAVEARFPGMRRTYARLKEGTYTGGNLFLLDPELFYRALPMAKKIVARRKNPLLLAPLFGLGAVFKLLTGRLTIGELEAIAERLFSVPMRAMIFPYPEIGVDVDKPDDLALVARELEGARA